MINNWLKHKYQGLSLAEILRQEINVITALRKTKRQWSWIKKSLEEKTGLRIKLNSLKTAYSKSSITADLDVVEMLITEIRLLEIDSQNHQPRSKSSDEFISKTNAERVEITKSDIQAIKPDSKADSYHKLILLIGDDRYSDFK